MTRRVEITKRSEVHGREQFDIDFVSFISAASRSSDSSVNLEKQGYTKFLLNYANQRKCEFWLARAHDSGQIIARLGADIPDSVSNMGSIGFFDCEPTPEGRFAATLLLTEAFAWLKGHGTQSVFGPMDFNSWFQYRFKLKNTEEGIPDFPWEPPPAQAHLDVFRETGFSEHIRYSSFFFEIPDLNIWDMYIARLEPDYLRVIDKGFTITGIRLDENLDSDLRKIFKLLNRSFAQSPMFEQIPFEIFSATTISTLKSKNCSGSSLCFTDQGKLVAFLFAFVSHGTLIYKTIAVDPDFQSLGIGNALTLQLCKAARQMGILKSAGALIRSGNTSEMIGRGFAKFAIASGQNEYILMRKDLL
jgi:hypothetical protein